MKIQDHFWTCQVDLSSFKGINAHKEPRNSWGNKNASAIAMSIGWKVWQLNESGYSSEIGR